MPEDADDPIAVLLSILAASKSFAYRCDNDEAVTMRYLAGQVVEITGCAPDELLGNRVLNYAALCHPEDLRPMIDQVDAAIADDLPWDVDYRLIRRDGSVLYVRERGAAVRAADGSISYLQGLVVNASAEETLKRTLKDRERAALVSNREILSLAGKIADTVRELTMLSVNARIEAARAGDNGRGFAVVATEMGDLAKTNAEWAARLTEKMTDAGAQ